MGEHLILHGMLYLAPDELSPEAECALAHHLIEDGDNPNDWTVLVVLEAVITEVGGKRLAP